MRRCVLQPVSVMCLQYATRMHVLSSRRVKLVKRAQTPNMARAAFARGWALLILHSAYAFSPPGVPNSLRAARRHVFTRTSLRGSRVTMSAATMGGIKGGLIVGLNKYSHDAGVCIIERGTGEVLFVGEKERISRRKHDAGDVADLVEHALGAIGSSLDDVDLVVQNNHHYRIAGFEHRLPWSVAQEHYPVSYLDEFNLFPSAKRKHELSHHLAHLWSVLPQAPFSEGLIVVMDGMGELHSAMTRALTEGDEEYTHDLLFKDRRGEGFVQVPESLDPSYGYREAESAYLFNGADVRPVFKRWTRERSPPELFNHGFQDMESLGAIYSRISSHIFGDWNTCGKVMGLAPYGRLMREKGEGEDIQRFMGGDLFKAEGVEGGFKIDWEALEALKIPNEWREPHKPTTDYYSRVADSVQTDLEDTALSFLTQLKQRTGAKNLCLAGGVALNSVLNGRITRELGFDRVFIPPYPGDEGIAVGCAFFGLHQLAGHQSLRGRYGLPYQGKAYGPEDMSLTALGESIEHWIEVEDLGSMERVVEDTARAIADGEVVAWFQGRAEVGPRALGSRSILADPRDATMIAQLNRVKRREAFRPFAPSVLAEDAHEWFDGLTADGSPFMSITVPVRQDQRDQVPAICHVDGTARLQTVQEEDNPWYHRLISTFKRLTNGVAMVLNTSFNIAGEPIVEDPRGAVESFLNAQGGINRLVLGTNIVRRRGFPPDDKGFDEAVHVPFKVEYALEEMVTDAETGEATVVRVARGSVSGEARWVELATELDLIVLQVIDGLTPLDEVVEIVMAEYCEATDHVEKDVTDAVRRLWDLRLVAFNR